MSNNETAANDGAKVKYLPTTIFAPLLILGFGIQYFWPLGFELIWGELPSQAMIGWVLMAVIAFPIAISAIMFRKSGQDPHPRQPTPVLITKGTYGFSRNPMYLGMALLITGLSLGLNNLWLFMILLPTMVAMDHYVIRPEEKYLEEKFGDEYRAYKAKVRRWI